MYTALRDRLSNQEDMVAASHDEFNQVSNSHVPHQRQRKSDLEKPVRDLAALNEKSKQLDERILDLTSGYDAAQDARKLNRQALASIRDSVNNHLDEDKCVATNLSEVEELCKLLDQKDKTLLLELMKIKD